MAQLAEHPAADWVRSSQRKENTLMSQSSQGGFRSGHGLTRRWMPRTVVERACGRANRCHLEETFGEQAASMLIQMRSGYASICRFMRAHRRECQCQTMCRMACVRASMAVRAVQVGTRLPSCAFMKRIPYESMLHIYFMVNTNTANATFMGRLRRPSDSGDSAL